LGTLAKLNNAPSKLKFKLLFDFTVKVKNNIMYTKKINFKQIQTNLSEIGFIFITGQIFIWFLYGNRN